MNNLTTLEQEIFAKFSQLESKESLEKLKIEILGKKGTLSKLFQDLATIDKEKKKEFSQSIFDNIFLKIFMERLLIKIQML